MTSDHAPSFIPTAIQVPGYEILGLLGHGGMGVVYKARHLALNRLVALKMILSGSHASDRELARFRDEAAAAARVQHPNLVQIYEVGEHEGRPYLALEYVGGGSLDRLLRSRRLAPAEAAAMIETLARAVHAVHQHGIVHRDLKPANILLATEHTENNKRTPSYLSSASSLSYVAKITDFGLAKRLDGPRGATMTGDILGTPAYMAPEQAGGHVKDIGPATDVYALGAILYEMLAGRPPFQADSGLDVLLMVTRDEPALPSRLQPRVPRDLETICLKCLEKQPARRYASAADLADDLQRYRTNEPIQARAIGPLGRAVKWARRHPARATLLAVATFGIAAFLFVSVTYNFRLQGALQEAQDRSEEIRRRLVRQNVTIGHNLLDDGDWFGALIHFAEALRLDQADAERAAMHRLRIGSVLRQCPALKQMWVHDRAVSEAAFSPDGKRVATASADRTGRIWSVDTGQQVGSVLTHDAAITHIRFSTDGQGVLTASRDGTARLWSAATGQPRTPPLKHGTPLVFAAYSPDGKFVATCGEDKVAKVWEAATGKMVPAVFNHDGPINAVAFSADSQWLATASGDKTARLWNLATGEPGPTLRHADKVWWVEFPSNGPLLVTASADGTAQLWNAATGTPHGKAMHHHQDVVFAAFSADGQRLATASDDHTARVWDAATGLPLTPPLRHKSGVNVASFHPDGPWLATGGDDGVTRLWNLATAEEIYPILLHHGGVSATRFSPDGKLLLSGGNGGLVRLHVVPDHLAKLRSDGPDAKKPRLPPAGQKMARSRDGRLVLKVNEEHCAGLFDAAGERTLAPLLTHGSAIVHVAFSPDEKRVLTTSEDQSARLWDAATGRLLTPPLKHEGPVVFAAFSADGTLVVTASRDKTARVWDAATGEPVTPPLLHATELLSAVLEADGLTVRTTDATGQQWTWWLERDGRPVEEIIEHAQTLAGSHLDPTWGYLPLEAGKLRDLLIQNR